MARKSLETMLVEAVNAGDIEKAKEIGLKIKNKTEKGVKTPKIKKTVKKIKTEPPEQVIDKTSEESYIDRPKNRPKKNKPESSVGNVQCRTEPIQIKKRKNLFVDNEQECSEDANVVLTRPIKNKKQKFKLSRIECRICGKEYNVAPIFCRRDEEGESLYRCNNCCGGR